MAAQNSEDGWGGIWVLIIAGLAFWYFSTTEKPTQIRTTPYIAPQSATPPAPPPKIQPPPPAPETHNYNFVEDGIYGYVSAVSEEDRKRGIAVGDVFLVRYLGKGDGNYRIQLLNDSGQVSSYNECPRPCGAIKSFAAGTMSRIPYNPRSIIGAAFEDAFLGKLRAKPIAIPKPVAVEPVPDEAAEATPSTDALPST